MRIICNQMGKRFNREWIFRNLDYDFKPGRKIALLGHNGSGKSTLLNILSAHLSPSKGSIRFEVDHKLLSPDQVFKHLGFIAPYIDLIEDFSLKEHIHFHTQFKSLPKGMDISAMIDLMGLQAHQNKAVRDFSSGMQQRLKLVLALVPENKLVLLDEPTSNLDQEGVEWYLNLIERFAEKKLIIVASNTNREYSFCREQIRIEDFKPKNIK